MQKPICQIIQLRLGSACTFPKQRASCVSLPVLRRTSHPMQQQKVIIWIKCLTKVLQIQLTWLESKPICSTTIEILNQLSKLFCWTVQFSVTLCILFVIMSMHVYTVVFSKIIFFSLTGITNTSLMLVVTLLQPNGERCDKDRLNHWMQHAVAV